MKPSLNVKDLSLNQLKDKLTNLTEKVFKKQEFDKYLEAVEKRDGTIVTRVDFLVHEFISEKLVSLGISEEVNFISEEADQPYRNDCYPSLVLDPIDGTKELAQGLSECCVSLAYLEDANTKTDKSWGWLYNPMTGFELSSEQVFTPGPALNKQVLLGLVSRTEFSKRLFANERPSHDVVIVPKGSIAFKLGLLAAGACDFVVSKRPKNLWDIAAGTLLCRDRGHHFYTEFGEVKSWGQIQGAQLLLWCRPELHHRVFPLFQT